MWKMILFILLGRDGQTENAEFISGACGDFRNINIVFIPRA